MLRGASRYLRTVTKFQPKVADATGDLAMPRNGNLQLKSWILSIGGSSGRAAVKDCAQSELSGANPTAGLQFCCSDDSQA